MNMASQKEPAFISILGRAFEIMEQMLRSDLPMGISQLSRETGIPKANTFRILKTLEELGAIQAEEDGYVLGGKMIKLGAGAKRNDNFFSIAIPHIRELATKCGESVNIGVLFQERVLILHTESAEQHSLIATLPPVTPMYCSSIGKLFLSRRSESELLAYFHAINPQARTVNTITTGEQFLLELPAILREGIAYDHEEYDYGLSCMATPILLYGRLVAGLSLSGPTSRLIFKGMASLEEDLKATARSVSEELTAKDVAVPDLN